MLLKEKQYDDDYVECCAFFTGMSDAPVQSGTPGYFHQNQPFPNDSMYTPRGDRATMLAARPGMRMISQGVVSVLFIQEVKSIVSYLR